MALCIAIMRRLAHCQDRIVTLPVVSLANLFATAHYWAALATYGFCPLTDNFCTGTDPHRLEYAFYHVTPYIYIDWADYACGSHSIAR